MKSILFLIFMLVVEGSTAQSVNGLTAPNWLNVADAAGNGVSAFAPLNDIGRIGELQSSTAAVSAERRVLGIDLQYIYGSFCLPLTNAGLGMSVSYVAADAWKQSKLGLTYGRRLASNFSLAIQLNYHRISVHGYGAGGTITPAGGISYHLTDKTVVRVFADNPFGGKIGNSNEKSGAHFTAMLSHEIGENLALALRISREQSAPADLLLLLNYALHSKLQLDGGISLNRANGFAGTSLSFRQVRLRQILFWSQALGFGTAISFEFRKPLKDE